MFLLKQLQHIPTNTGNIEHLIDQVGQAMYLVNDAIQSLRVLSGILLLIWHAPRICLALQLALEQFNITQDGGERGAQFMAGERQKLILKTV